MPDRENLDLSIRSVRPDATSALMEKTGLEEHVIDMLVRRFYEKARSDSLLGPVFAEHVTNWEPHLQKMADFWSSVALMTGRYHGSPMHAHLGLRVGRAHFDRWLDLFRETASEICTPEGSALLIERAESMARAVYRTVAGHTYDRDDPLDEIGNKETEMNDETGIREIVPLDDDDALTRYIEERYHQRHRQELPELAALAAKVEAVHDTDPNTPSGLAALLKHMVGSLEVHMKKEELILFPAIRRGGTPGIDAPIAVMRADHDEHTQEIDSIRQLTSNLTLPHGACRTWTALYEGLGRFIADLEEHVRLENEVLFPRYEKRSA